MDSSKRLGEILVEVGGYKDLKDPVILTSGELSIYFVNAEKVVQDNNAWEKFGDDPVGMRKHLAQKIKEKPLYAEATILLAEEGAMLLPIAGRVAVSGGQRRDWIFSFPVAEYIGVPHIALFKETNDGVREPIVTEGEKTHDQYNLEGHYAVHVVDMITEGSSVYRKDNGKRRGWVPMLESRRTVVQDLIAMVTRLQGGEQNLAAQGVNVHAGVTIGADFLNTHSRQPEIAVRYFANPNQWSLDYLAEHGTDALVGTFDPKGGKLDRAAKFLGRYEQALRDMGKYDSLVAQVKAKYGTALPTPIIGGKALP